MIEKFAAKDFTVFDKIRMDFCPGINVIIGENGTGKTHILKAAYDLCQAGRLKQAGEELFESNLGSYILATFLPEERRLVKLCKWGSGNRAVLAADFSQGRRISAQITEGETPFAVTDNNFPKHYEDYPVYIPAKEVLSFMRGFVGLFDGYELSFDITYRDLARSLDVPALRSNKLSAHSRRIMDAIEKIIGGHFVFGGSGIVTFVSQDEQYSANATAEGYLQLGMLHRLLENGAVDPKSSGPLFWDLPEMNLSPKMLKVLAWIMLELAREGQQIVLATHSYVLLKYFELLADPEKGDVVRYHALSRDKGGNIKHKSVDSYNQLPANAITETFLNLFDLEVERSAKGEAK